MSTCPPTPSARSSTLSNPTPGSLSIRMQDAGMRSPATMALTTTPLPRNRLMPALSSCSATASRAEAAAHSGTSAAFSVVVFSAAQADRYANPAPLAPYRQLNDVSRLAVVEPGHQTGDAVHLLVVEGDDHVAGNNAVAAFETRAPKARSLRGSARANPQNRGSRDTELPLNRLAQNLIRLN